MTVSEASVHRRTDVGTSAHPPTLRLGTRGSTMARTQSQAVAESLRQGTGAAADLVVITTHGDV